MILSSVFKYFGCCFRSKPPDLTCTGAFPLYLAFTHYYSLGEKNNNYLHLCSLWQWHIKYSDGVWQSWRLTTTQALFNIPCHLIEPLTQIVIYLFQIRHMRCIAIIELVNIHHFHPKDYTSYLKWYSIKYDRKNTEWSVLARIWLMLWEEKKKNTLLELRSKSRLPEETAVRFLCLCHILHFILCSTGTEPQCTAPRKPQGCNRMPLWNI